MPIGINLLPEKARLKFARVGKFSQVRTGLLIFSLFFFIFSAVVLVANIYFKRQSVAINRRQQAARRRIDAQKETELQAFLLEERVREAVMVLETRNNVGILLWQVIEIFPPEAKFKELAATTKQIRTALGFPTYIETSHFVDNFPKKEIEELGGKVAKLSSVKRGPEGKYQIPLEIQF